jgi:hypothetical protein
MPLVARILVAMLPMVPAPPKTVTFNPTPTFFKKCVRSVFRIYGNIATAKYIN